MFFVNNQLSSLFFLTCLCFLRPAGENARFPATAPALCSFRPSSPLEQSRAFAVSLTGCAPKLLLWLRTLPLSQTGYLSMAASPKPLSRPAPAALRLAGKAARLSSRTHSAKQPAEGFRRPAPFLQSSMPAEGAFFETCWCSMASHLASRIVRPMLFFNRVCSPQALSLKPVGAAWPPTTRTALHGPRYSSIAYAHRRCALRRSLL